MEFYHSIITLPVAASIVAFATVAEASVLSFTGQVQLYEPVTCAISTRKIVPDPVPGARVMVTFHGHEAGITEYTTERTSQTVTDAAGFFTVDMKLSEYRYRWTHVSIAIEPTDISKGATITAVLYNDGQGGSQGRKDIVVMPQ